MRVKRLPTILALHLKRFKYMEQMNRFIKVSHRVVFPLELRLFNTVSAINHITFTDVQPSHLRPYQSDDAVNPDRMYDLVAVVIHCGSGPNRGHYISIVKSCGLWLIFDDDIVDVSFVAIDLFGTSPSINIILPPENRSLRDRGLLWAHGRHTEIVGDRIHSVLPIEGWKLLASK